MQTLVLFTSYTSPFQQFLAHPVKVTRGFVIAFSTHSDIVVSWLRKIPPGGSKFDHYFSYFVCVCVCSSVCVYLYVCPYVCVCTWECRKAACITARRTVWAHIKQFQKLRTHREKKYSNLWIAAQTEKEEPGRFHWERAISVGSYRERGSQLWSGPPNPLRRHHGHLWFMELLWIGPQEACFFYFLFFFFIFYFFFFILEHCHSGNMASGI